MAMPELFQGRLALPVIGSPLFILSGPELVIAQCKAGVIGSFPALNARPQALLDTWLTSIRDALDDHQMQSGQTAAPFAVNQICHPSNDRLMADMDTCEKHRVPVIITSLRAPAELVARVHGWGGIVFHDVINLRHARRAVRDGVDGLILVCAGAGGHAGTLSPFALLREVREFFDGPIALAGAIGDGASILSALAMGADLAYMGTRFIATEEARAAPAYKDMLLQSAADDIVYSSLFTGVSGNYLKESIRAAGLDPDDLQAGDKSAMNFQSGGDSLAKAWRDIWGAGQGVGIIHDVPATADLVTRLCAEFAQAREQLEARLSTMGS